MKILKLSTKLETLEKEASVVKQELVSELNLYLRPLFGRTVSEWYNIRVTRKVLDKELCHFLAGQDVLEIWETSSDSDGEHAASYCIPVSFLTDKQFKYTWKKMQADYKLMQKQWEKERVQKAKAFKEEHDRKEFARLKKKFKA